MIKKLTLFFSSHLRKQIQADDSLRTSPGLIAAMAFPHKLVATAMTRKLMSESNARDLAGDAWKFFDGLHAESNHVRTAIRLTQRVEGALSTSMNDSVRLDLSFFWKGKREASYKVSFWFSKEGEIGGGGESISNDFSR